MHLPIRPRLIGPACLTAGFLVLTVAVAIASPGAKQIANAAFVAQPVWLAITLSDSAGGRYQPSSTVTVTATITNVSTTTVGTDFTGSTTTATISAVAHPTVTFNLSTVALSFVSNQGTYTCAATTGQVTCSDSSLLPGSSATIPIVLTVVGAPGTQANVTASVNGNVAEANQAGSSATATDTASITSTSSTSSTSTTSSSSSSSSSPCGSTDQSSDKNRGHDDCHGRGRHDDCSETDDSISQATANTVEIGDGETALKLTISSGALPAGTELNVHLLKRGCEKDLLGFPGSQSNLGSDAILLGYIEVMPSRRSEASSPAGGPAPLLAIVASVLLIVFGTVLIGLERRRA